MVATGKEAGRDAMLSPAERQRLRAAVDLARRAQLGRTRRVVDLAIVAAGAERDDRRPGGTGGEGRSAPPGSVSSGRALIRPPKTDQTPSRRREPKPDPGGKCARVGCKKPLPRSSQAACYCGDALALDPFCSTRCCREFHSTLKPESAAERGQRERGERGGPGASEMMRRWNRNTWRARERSVSS